jgi:DNA-binding CsgD family transcriptional regulator
MATDLPELPFAPESGQNLSQTRDFERNREISPGANLSDTQLNAIDLLLQGYNETQTAQALSINRRTLYHWKTHDEDYREALAEARHQFHATVTDRLESIVFKATSTLVKFLEDPTDASRMKAAQILLNVASRYKPEPPPKRPQTPTQKEIANYYFPPPILEPKVG